ncbi:MAG: FkbM family methyltransferase [Pseudomonadota bacterium]
MRKRPGPSSEPRPFEISELSWRARFTYVAHAAKAVFKSYHHEMRTALGPLIASDAAVFDVGGHAGQFAKLFARLAPKGQIYVFEPGGYALSILRLAVQLNRLKNVHIVPMGLGDRPDRLILNVPIKSSGSYGFGLSHLGAPADSRPRRREYITVTTMDRFVSECGLSRLDLIKADIEGWELRMLVGGAATVDKLRPALLLEVNDTALRRAGDDAASLWQWLTTRDYVPFAIGADGSPKPVDAPEDGDVLWLPRECVGRG